MRVFKIAFGSTLALGCIGVVMLKLGHLEVQRLNAQVESLEKEKVQLGEYIKRLSASRRVAQADCLRQTTDDHGRIHSLIRWLEIAPDGTLGEPQSLETLGELVYFEAAVIKFTSESIAAAEPGRTTSLALFRRIFGDMQTPALVANLEPFIYSNETQAETKEHERLWELFWQMMEDPALAERYNVRVAQVEAPAVRVRAGQIFEVSLDAAGGLNVKLIGRRDDVPTSKRTITAASG